MAFNMLPVESKSGNHKEQGYDEESQILRVRYGSGKVWDFHGVTPEMYKASQEAPSFGSYLKRIIEPGCPGAPVDEPPELPQVPE